MIIYAYAKINLTLDIIGRREDGYHLIDSVFQSVGLYDILEIKKSETITVNCGEIEQKQNIAYTAAKEFFKFSGIKGGAEINIEKRIPLLSGLGGGSADAAAVIVALDSLYRTGLSKDELVNIALKCGADVPFFIYGGTKRVGGIGEIIKPLPDIKDCYAVLVKSGGKKSTKDMYKRLDSLPQQESRTQRFTEAYGEEKFNFTGNAFSLLAEDKNVVSALKDQHPIAVSVSGSGPTHFALFSAENQAKKASECLENQGFKPIIAPFVNCGVKITD